MPYTADLTPTRLRVFIYDHLLANGAPPTSGEIGLHFDVPAETARRAVALLKIGKTVLPDPKTSEIWMAGPFGSRRSAYRVFGQHVAWWANCAWDALGVMVIAGEVVDVETTCADCGEAIELHATPEHGVGGAAQEMVVHFLLPARRWYDDIGFT